MAASTVRTGRFVLEARAGDLIYGAEERREIERRVALVGPQCSADQVRQDPGLLRGVEVVLSGWGSPRFDAALLSAATDLKLVLYGAGSVAGVVSPEFWDRGVRIVSAWAANAVPVSEYTLGQILLSLKRVWHHDRAMRASRQWRNDTECPGAYQSTVGLISLGVIGSRVAQLLRHFELRVLAWSPYTTQEQAQALGVRLVPSLDDLFAQCDVVSLHTAWKKQTENLVRGSHLERMKPHSTFINTARGAIVNEPEMIAVLQRRPQITAILDVTYPEPPAADSPLYTLPNVVLTPHIAGAQGRECRRMGRFIIEELDRYLAGQPLKWEVTREAAELMA